MVVANHMLALGVVLHASCHMGGVGWYGGLQINVTAFSTADYPATYASG